MDHWVNGSTNGWSSRGGQTTGAYYAKMDPSGSSHGSGVSASIRLALAALGTETYRSILSPSQQNCSAGIKPSVGLTSRYLVVPISQVVTVQDALIAEPGYGWGHGTNC